jgi:NTE family protein
MPASDFSQIGPSADTPTVLVLGGGGSRCALQIGTLRALADMGFAPDVCVGTSAGALNASMVAAVPLAEAVDRLERLWTSPLGRAAFRLPLHEVAQNIAARKAWVKSGRSLRALVSHALSELGITDFSELRLPLHVVVCNLLLGRTEVLRAGPLEDALVASCSIPGLFPPVSISGALYVDGGVMENCALSVAAGMRPGRIVAIDITTEAEVTSIGRWMDVVDRVLGLGQRARVGADYDLYSPDVPLTLLLPCPSRRIASLDAFDAVQLSHAAASATRRVLPSLLGDDGQLRPGLHEIPVALPEVATRRRVELGEVWPGNGIRSRLFARRRLARSGAGGSEPAAASVTFGRTTREVRDHSMVP